MLNEDKWRYLMIGSACGQLVERLLPTPKVWGSNPVIGKIEIGNFFTVNCKLTRRKYRKRGREPPIKKAFLMILQATFVSIESALFEKTYWCHLCISDWLNGIVERKEIMKFSKKVLGVLVDEKHIYLFQIFSLLILKRALLFGLIWQWID